MKSSDSELSDQEIYDFCDNFAVSGYFISDYEQIMDQSFIHVRLNRKDDFSSLAMFL